MNVIILAAGFATRLYPLTENFPKALLEINGRPILNYLVNDLINLPDLAQVTLVTNQRYAKHFESWLGENKLPGRVSLINNGVSSPETRNGAIGDMQLALAKMPDTDTLILASDTLISEALSNFVIQAKKKQLPANMLIKMENKAEIANRLGCAVINQEQNITQFVEKPKDPPSSYASVPYYYFPKETLHFIHDFTAEFGFNDAPGSLLAWLITKTPVFAYVIDSGYYFDIGTPEALTKAKKLLES